MKILVTGASGLLGSKLCMLLQKDHRVVGIVHSYSPGDWAVDLYKSDLTQLKKTRELLHHIKPDAIIHAAALSQPELCERSPEKSRIVNVEVPLIFARYTQKHKIPYIFTSTDLVFDGLNPPFAEEDTCAPINMYGRHKFQAETLIKKLNQNAIICRLPLLFGFPLKNRSNFLSSLYENLLKGKTIPLFTDEFRTPISVLTASRGLRSMLSAPGGIYHLGGTERISRYTFGRRFCQVFSLPDNTLRACRRRDVLLAAPRPRDVSLISKKAEAYNYKPVSVKLQLEELKLDLKVGPSNPY